jgi:glycine cleavage system aminomethyltransferase T
MKKSLALAYVDRDVIESADDLDVYIVGEARTARVLPAAPYDSTSCKLRG